MEMHRRIARTASSFILRNLKGVISTPLSL